MSNIADFDGSALRRLYRSGKLSPVEVVRDVFDRADRFEPAVNAFTILDREAARAAAKASEARWRRGEPHRFRKSRRRTHGERPRGAR